jgi:hypothetical protein
MELSFPKLAHEKLYAEFTDIISSCWEWIVGFFLDLVRCPLAPEICSVSDFMSLTKRLYSGPEVVIFIRINCKKIVFKA